MTTIQHTVLAADIPEIVTDPSRGVISLIGNHGGMALITGDCEPSSMKMGLLAFETEHGTIYLDPDAEVTIGEELGHDDEHEWSIAWEIDANGPTPEAAAARVWTSIFGRSMAGTDDACVFTVTDPGSKVAHRIDLSEHDLETLT